MASKDNSMSTTQHSLRRGQTVRLNISSLAPGGEGVSKDFGIPIFVARVAPGDVVDVKLFDVRKQFAKGAVEKIVTASELRSEPPCPLFKVCGGCQWQHMGYSNQLLAKTDIVKQAIKHIGKLDDALVQPCIAAVSPLSYRNKAQFPVEGVAKTGRLLAGYYQQNSHDLVNIKHCPVQPEPMDRALEASKELLQAAGISAYDENAHQGLLRHIAERYSFANKEILLTWVINAGQPLSADLRTAFVTAAKAVIERVPEVRGVCLNYNPARGNRIMGDTTECIAGDEHIVEILHSHLTHAPQRLLDGIKFRLSSTSFFQVNSEQAAVLLDQILLAVAADAGNHDPFTVSFTEKIPLLIDAYAGVGTMGLWLASICDKVIAIEEWASAVDDGKVNLQLNALDNVEFQLGKVEDQVPKLVAAGVKPNVVVVDPPRKGVDPQGLQSIIELKADRIVYVSCNPATLARDLRILEDGGYKTKRVQPVDMFPQTYHVESVTVLDRAPN